MLSNTFALVVERQLAQGTERTQTETNGPLAQREGSLTITHVTLVDRSYITDDCI